MVPEWLQIRLWLDDQWADPNMPARHPPPGWTPVATAMEACRFIRTGCVVEIDFDHDLGKEPSGAVVARLIEARAFRKEQRTPRWAIHSANPVGRANITATMHSAERFWT